MLVITGFGTSNVLEVSLETEFTLTCSGPVVAVAGTLVMICASLQLVITVAGTPLNVTVLLPCVGWKLTPLMVTCVPATPPAGVIV